jgi:hypothetical protein
MNMLMTLQARQTASLAPQGTVRVRCLRGMLWIVGQRDGEDCVLEAGQTALLGAERHYLSSVRRNDAVSFELRPQGPRAGITAPGLSAVLAGFWQRLRQFF